MDPLDHRRYGIKIEGSMLPLDTAVVDLNLGRGLYQVLNLVAVNRVDFCIKGAF